MTQEPKRIPQQGDEAAFPSDAVMQRVFDQAVRDDGERGACQIDENALEHHETGFRAQKMRLDPVGGEQRRRRESSSQP